MFPTEQFEVFERRREREKKRAQYFTTSAADVFDAEIIRPLHANGLEEEP